MHTESTFETFLQEIFMHPAPIKVNTISALPHDAVYVETLASGERIYRTLNGTIYALQPRSK
jgi:hypothetical protein